jgi:hypothetical protein
MNQLPNIIHIDQLPQPAQPQPDDGRNALLQVLVQRRMAQMTPDAQMAMLLQYAQQTPTPPDASMPNALTQGGAMTTAPELVDILRA